MSFKKGNFNDDLIEQPDYIVPFNLTTITLSMHLNSFLGGITNYTLSGTCCIQIHFLKDNVYPVVHEGLRGACCESRGDHMSFEA